MNKNRTKLLELLGKLTALKSASDWIPDLENRIAFEETADLAIGICAEIIKETPKTN